MMQRCLGHGVSSRGSEPLERINRSMQRSMCAIIVKRKALVGLGPRAMSEPVPGGAEASKVCV